GIHAGTRAHPRLEFEVCGRRTFRLNRNILLNDYPCLWMPDDHLVRPGRDVLDLKVSLCISQGVIGIVHGEPPALHVRMEPALHTTVTNGLNWQSLASIRGS